MAPDTGVVFSTVLAVLLLVFSGFASGSEIAFFSLSPTDLNELDGDKNPSDRSIEMLRKDVDKVRTHSGMAKDVKDRLIQKRHLLRLQLDYLQGKYKP